MVHRNRPISADVPAQMPQRHLPAGISRHCQIMVSVVKLSVVREERKASAIRTQCSGQHGQEQGKQHQEGIVRGRCRRDDVGRQMRLEAFNGLSCRGDLLVAAPMTRVKPSTTAISDAASIR